MRYASAMLYGGQLIDAADADKDLSGLLCPHCKQPVFLQAGYSCQVGDTGVEIPAHFKHIIVRNSALVKKCESRVQKYDAAEIQRRAAQAKNQRLRILQRGFWGILVGYYEGELGFPIANVLEMNGRGLLAEMGYMFRNNFLAQNLQALKKVTVHMVEAACVGAPIVIRLEPGDPTIGMTASTGIRDHLKNSLSGKLDRQIQGLIACDVMDFLQLKAPRSLVEKLFILACWSVLDAVVGGVRLGLLGADGSELVVRSPEETSIDTQFWVIPQNQEIFYHYAVSYVCFWLAMLPWARQMNFAR